MSPRITGYAAIFDAEDLGGDTIRPGAFDRTLLRRPSGHPLLWQHDYAFQIGEVAALQVDETGLLIEAQFGTGELARAIYAMVKAGAILGLSFGYRVHRSKGHGRRELLALDLLEVSIVVTPMNPMALINLPMDAILAA
jgi:HK97 family phage prohead protease